MIFYPASPEKLSERSDSGFDTETPKSWYRLSVLFEEATADSGTRVLDLCCTTLPFTSFRYSPGEVVSTAGCERKKLVISSVICFICIALIQTVAYSAFVTVLIKDKCINKKNVRKNMVKQLREDCKNSLRGDVLR